MTAELQPVEDFLLPSQCVATAKSSGKQCSKPAIPGGTVCKYHGGGAPQVRAAAARRIAEARDLMLSRLMEQLEPPENPLYAIEPKVLIDGAEKFSKLVNLLSGEATERTESTKVEEVRHRLEVELERLGSRLETDNIGGGHTEVIDVDEIDDEDETDS